MLQHPHIDQCPLFQGLSPEKKDYALSYFDAQKSNAMKKGSFSTGSPSPSNGLGWSWLEPFRSIWTTWMDTILL